MSRQINVAAIIRAFYHKLNKKLFQTNLSYTVALSTISVFLGSTIFYVFCYLIVSFPENKIISLISLKLSLPDRIWFIFTYNSINILLIFLLTLIPIFQKTPLTKKLAKTKFQNPIVINIICCLCLYGFYLITLIYDDAALIDFIDFKLLGSMWLFLITLFFSVYLYHNANLISLNKIAKILHKPEVQYCRVCKDNNYKLIPAYEIKSGDTVYVNTGEYFPVDGVVKTEEFSIDESFLSGEAHTAYRPANSKVKAGSRNLDKPVILTASTSYNDSYLAIILNKIAKHKFKLTIARKKSDISFAQFIFLHQLFFYLIGLSACFWWFPHNSNYAYFLLLATFILFNPIIICLARPLTSALITKKLSEKGIVITNLASLWHFCETDNMIFDKTGTITEGEVKVESIDHIRGDPTLNLGKIAATEKLTRHPIADAIVKFTKDKLEEIPDFAISKLKVFPGRGIRAIIEGKVILIGNGDWLRKNGIFIPKNILQGQSCELLADNLFVHCSISNQEVARIRMKDRVRKGAMETINFLHNKDIELSLFSGDQQDIVKCIAKQLGPLNANWQMPPMAKEQAIETLQNQGLICAMVGDGLNDALALKAADIGILMGTKSPTAMLCADIVLKNSDLSQIPLIYNASKLAHQITKGLVTISNCFNLILLALLISGIMNPLLLFCAVSAQTCLIAFGPKIAINKRKLF